MGREDEKYLSLIRPLISASASENGVDVQKSEISGFMRTKLIILNEEVSEQLFIAVPLVTLCILQTLTQVISVAYVRRFGEFFLSAASMANFFVSATLFCLLVSSVNPSMCIYYYI